MKAIKYLIVLGLIVISTIASGQKGKINQNGFFAFKNYRCFLEYLDYCNKNDLRGRVYICFEVKYPEQQRSSDYVITAVETSEDTLLNAIKIDSYSCLRKGLIYDSSFSFLHPYFLDNISYENIDKLSTKDFYYNFLQGDEVINIDDFETKKAVIFKFLKENFLVYEHDISGNIALGKTQIKW